MTAPPRARALRWIPLALTALLGIAASATGAFLFYDGEGERLHLALDYRAEWRAKDLETKLRAIGTPVGGFATFLAMQLADGLNPDGASFARWAQIRSDYADNKPRTYYWWPYLSTQDSAASASIASHPDPGFQTPLHYAPGGDKGEASELTLEADAQAATREVLIRAWFSGAVRMSRPYRTWGWPDSDATEIMFAAPIYRSGRMPTTIADRQASLAGVVAAGFSLHDVLEAAIRDTPRISEAIYISEEPWPADDTRQYFARYDPDKNDFIMEIGSLRPSDLAGVVIAKRVEGQGVNFYMLSQFLPAEVAAGRSPGPWLFLFSGLLLTTAAVGYVHLSLMRREALTTAVSISDARLRQTHRELEAVIRSSPAAIVCVDNARVVTVWNMAAERLFGLSALEAVGRRYQPPASGNGVQPPELGRAIAEGLMIDGTASLVTADGRKRDVSVRSAILTGDESEMLGAVYVASDVTDMVMLEEQLRQAQKMEAIGQLTGGVAHDFNNLLAVVIGNLDLIGTAFNPDSRNAKLLDGALRAALRGADLTRALLAFARRQPLQPAPVNINQLIEGVCTLLEHSLGETVAVVRELQADLWPVSIDAVQLESALTNLAINARDAMPSGGRLLIQTRNTHLDSDYALHEPGLVAGDYVVIEVTDNGHGMPPEVLAHAAEPFFTTKGEGKGTGLGLAMVYGFVKQSAGHMKIYSELGRGTTVRLYLPRLGGRIRDAGVATLLPSTAAAPKTVLVVEDNADLRRLVVGQIQGLGYKVIEAVDGDQALEIASGPGTIDLVFSDVVMSGGLSGFDLVRELRQRRPKLKLLLTSGFPGAMSVPEREIEPGFIVPILTKPYRRDELARQLREILEEAD
ncbi:ATP-binding protein [Hypericibacter adhaerens]|uniref:ATP-binding protein n=1 Tax=Hypericibacter adhaerens TaxID=2602016 RepID=UPI00124570A1|nr:ATP-binding protein [Hypericibacter adhaerens]